jgi:5-methylcytosine-specific restriction enzyme A
VVIARYCMAPGCRAKVKGTPRCPTHQTASHETDVRQRGTAAERGYDAKWRRIRARKLKRNPLCEHCEREGRVTRGAEVDHITPLSQGGTHQADNLQTLCRSHHARKTAREKCRQDATLGRMLGGAGG